VFPPAHPAGNPPTSIQLPINGKNTQNIPTDQGNLHNIAHDHKFMLEAPSPYSDRQLPLGVPMR
jgi:hypothetical protein